MACSGQSNAFLRSLPALREWAATPSVGSGRLYRRHLKVGDRRVRTLLYEAANVMLTLKLKHWALAIAKRSAMRKVFRH